MELYHLKTFVAIAEERSLTRASERLFTSQPAISAQVKALEEALGVTLFDRTPRGMRLTAAGEDLLPFARQTLDSASALLQHAKGLHGELVGNIRIGLNTDARFLRVTALQAGLAVEHARLEVSMLAGTTGVNLPALRAGRLDAAFLSGHRDEPDLHLLHLCEEPLAIAAPRAMREQIGAGDLATLARLPWVFTSPDCAYFHAMRVLFQRQGYEPTRTLLANQEDAMLELVRAGVGLGIVRAGILGDEDDDAWELPVAVPSIPLYVAWLRQRSGDPMIRALLAVVRDVWNLNVDADATDTRLRAAS